jgi:NAD dependent epimerase/dehydratase
LDYHGAKVLVTGADGFIGSHLTEALVKSGADVAALCLYNSFDNHGWIDDLPASTRTRLQTVRGDVRDTAFMHRLIEVQDIVFHLAALIAIPHSYFAVQSYVETNVLGTLHVLEGARNSSVRRVIVTSTSEVYGTALSLPIDEAHPLQAQSPYAATKIGADMLAAAFARSFTVPVVLLRPFNTFGPRQSERAIIPTIIRQALDPSCDALRLGDTSTVRDFTYVEDTVAAFLAIGRSPNVELGCPYNAGSGKSVSVAEVIEIVAELTDCRKPLQYEEARMRPPQSEVRALLADSSRLFANTGWQPTITLREGLERTVEWWRSRLASGRVRATARFMV